jgi:transcriptional antiterminator NusG
MLEIRQPNWFALYVRSKSEKMVASLLHLKGYDDFLPLYRPTSIGSRARREVPLFPGYLFCRSTPDAVGLIVTTPGIVRILGVGSKPQPIEDCEIAALKTVLSSGFPLRPWPMLDPGDRILITRGPLRGIQGVLMKWRGHAQLLVSVEILQRSVAVEIPVGAIASTNMLSGSDTDCRLHQGSKQSLQHVC